MGIFVSKYGKIMRKVGLSLDLVQDPNGKTLNNMCECLIRNTCNCCSFVERFSRILYCEYEETSRSLYINTERAQTGK